MLMSSVFFSRSLVSSISGAIAQLLASARDSSAPDPTCKPNPAQGLTIKNGGKKTSLHTHVFTYSRNTYVFISDTTNTTEV